MKVLKKKQLLTKVKKIPAQFVDTKMRYRQQNVVIVVVLLDSEAFALSESLTYSSENFKNEGRERKRDKKQWKRSKVFQKIS